MTLATADGEGRPSARTVLLKGVDERGFLFFSNYESRKGPSSPRTRGRRSSSTGPRIRAGRSQRRAPSSGSASEESEEYFRTRPLGSRLGAWASRQSEPISDRAALERAYADAEERYGTDPPVPPWWGGYLLRPERVEFWQNRPNRLHDRFRYTRGEQGAWRVVRLAP